MPETNDWMNGELDELRRGYNPPPETPREEMWADIQARLEIRGEHVVSLAEARAKRPALRRRAMGWATAAAAVLVVGIGIGRLTAPGEAPGVGMAAAPATVTQDPDVFRAAAVNHLDRTETLLTLVRADARAGRVPPSLGEWSRTLLSQTRLLMDFQRSDDPVMAELLSDLELVLIQLVAIANEAPSDQERVRSEMNLALEGLEENEVLPRIQAVVTAGPRRYGT
jgi:hypothetical protein